MGDWSTIKKLIFLRGGISGGSELPWKTITGNPLTFVARSSHVLNSCVVGIEPVQSGSGTPSPDNVRPISGLTGANVYVEPAYDASASPKVSVSWQSTAGTVYGGSLDVTTGLLTKTYGFYTFTGNESNYTQQTGRVAIKLPIIVGSTSLLKVSAYCSDFLCTGSGSTNWVYLSTSLAAEDLKTYMGNHTVTLVYPLNTPQTYQLTAQEVSAISGQNTMWTDCATLTVEARAKN